MALKVWIITDQRVRRGLGAVLACEAVLRQNGVGTWRLTLDGAHKVSQMFDRGWRVSVYDDDSFLFSGPATVIRRRYTAANGDELELEGVTDMTIIRDRMAYPNAASNMGMNNAGATPLPASAYYQAGVGTTATPAEKIIIQTLNDHVTASAPLSQRRTDGVPAIPMPATPRGTNVTINARFTNLLEEVESLARLGGLIVEAGQTADSTSIVLSIRTPRDLSARIRFTTRNGLGDHEVTLRAPEVTTAFAGGAGDGTGRDVLGENGPVKWGNRRVEVFYDRRDIADGDSNALLREARDRYTEFGETASAQFELTETARTRLGRDFLLGDKVTVQTPSGATISGALTTAELKWDGYGRVVRLTLGETVPTNEAAPEWVKRVRKLERSMRRMEGAQ